MRSGGEEQTACAPGGDGAAVCVSKEKAGLCPPGTAHGGGEPLALKDTSLKIIWRKIAEKKEKGGNNFSVPVMVAIGRAIKPTNVPFRA